VAEFLSFVDLYVCEMLIVCLSSISSDKQALAGSMDSSWGLSIILSLSIIMSLSIVQDGVINLSYLFALEKERDGNISTDSGTVGVDK
jgi:hypothetical protein